MSGSDNKALLSELDKAIANLVRARYHLHQSHSAIPQEHIRTLAALETALLAISESDKERRGV